MSVAAIRWALGAAPADLGGAGMSVLLILANTANDGHDQQVWLTRHEIAALARVTPNTVGTTVAKLQAADLIERVPASEKCEAARRRANRTAVWRLKVTDPTLSIHQQVVVGNEPQTPRRGAWNRGSPSSIEKQPPDPLRVAARSALDAWWEGQYPRPLIKYPAALKIIEGAMRAGWSVDAITHALTNLDGPLATFRLEQGLRRYQPTTPTNPAASRWWETDGSS